MAIVERASVLGKKTESNTKLEEQIFNAVRLPLVYLHGFSQPEFKGTPIKTPEDKRTEDEIKRFEDDGTTKPETDAADKSVQVVGKKSKTPETRRYEELLGNDISGDINISKFVVGCSWSHTIKPPFGTANITLVLPTELANFLLHGDIAVLGAADNDTTRRNTSARFRHIQAGGWMSIALPHAIQDLMFKSADSYTDKGTAVFFGKIVNIDLTNTVSAAGAHITTVSLSCSTWMYPYFASEHRLTPMRKGEVDRVHDSAIGTLFDDKEKQTDGLIQKAVESLKNLDHPIKTLKILVQGLGHFKLPDTLGGKLSRKKSGELHDLGSVINYIGDWDEQKDGEDTYWLLDKQLLGTPYSQTTGAGDVIVGAPIPSNNFKAIFSRTTTMWQMLENMFIGNKDLVELFPVLIPYHKKLSEQAGQSDPAASASTKLRDAIGATPYLVYRLKPLQPDFDITEKVLNERYQDRLGGAAKGIVSGETNYQKYFITKEEASSDIAGKYIDISKQVVISEQLQWSDSDRYNATHMTDPFRNESAADLNLFNIGTSVAVLNPNDINLNGLRTYTSTIPFTRAKIKGSDDLIASGAFTERAYFTLGEGHAYAKGTITCQFLSTPDLVPGVWAKILDDRKDEIGIRSNLVFYIEDVRHEVSVNPGTGAATGRTTLTISRASYGDRIPIVKLGDTPTVEVPKKENKAEKQIDIYAPEGTTAPTIPTKKRTKNRKVKK